MYLISFIPLNTISIKSEHFIGLKFKKLKIISNEHRGNRSTFKIITTQVTNNFPPYE